jgi:hypothetical protein
MSGQTTVAVLSARHRIVAHFCYIPFPQSVVSDYTVTNSIPSDQTIIYTNLSAWDDGTLLNEGAAVDNGAGHFIDKGRRFHKAPRPLARLTEADTLSVSAHGIGGLGSATNSTMLMADINSPIAQRGYLTVNSLALRLRKDGLPKSFKWLQLSICFSALEPESRFPGQVSFMTDPHAGYGLSNIFGDENGTAASQCLAAVLARTLGLLGYANIIVAGAPGEVTGGNVVFGRQPQYTMIGGVSTRGQGLHNVSQPFGAVSHSYDSQGRRIG